MVQIRKAQFIESNTEPVDAASTTNVNLASTVSVTFDGATLVEGDSVLLKDQTDSSENGIYVIGSVSGGQAELTRRSDFNSSRNVFRGIKVSVLAGDTQENSEWILTTAGDITVGSTNLEFEQISGGGDADIQDEDGNIQPTGDIRFEDSIIENFDGYNIVKPERQIVDLSDKRWGIEAFDTAGETTDQWAKIQAIIDSHGGNTTFILPKGWIQITRSIRVKENHTKIIGHGSAVSNIFYVAPGRGGWAFYGGADRSDLLAAALSPPISPDEDNSYRISNDTDTSNPGVYFIPLHDLQDIHLIDGLTRLNIRMWLKPRKLPSNGSRFILYSEVRRFTAEATTSAFILKTNVNSILRFELTTDAGTGVVADSGPLVEGVAFHLSLDWDGSTLRMFKDGSLISSTALSGSIKKGRIENILLGHRLLGWPSQQLITSGLDGYVGSVEISRTSRNTTGFTVPSSKHPGDGDTLALLNFDDENIDGDMFRVISRIGEVWLPHMDQRLILNSDFELKDFSVRGAGLVLSSGFTESRYERLIIRQAMNGIRLWNNSFTTKIQDCKFLLNNSIAATNCVSSTMASGVVMLQKLIVEGGDYPVWIRGAGVTTIDVWIVGPSARIFYLVEFSGGPAAHSIFGLRISDEGLGGPAPNLEYVVVFSGVRALNANNIILDTPQTPIPQVLFVGGENAFIYARPRPNSGAPYIIEHLPGTDLPNVNYFGPRPDQAMPLASVDNWINTDFGDHPRGPNLTDSNETISTSGGLQRILPPATLTQDRTITLSNALPDNQSGDRITITREDFTNHDLIINNGGPAGGTLFIFPGGSRGEAEFYYNGTDWELTNPSRSTMQTDGYSLSVDVVPRNIFEDETIADGYTFQATQEIGTDTLVKITAEAIADDGSNTFRRIITSWWRNRAGTLTNITVTGSNLDSDEEELHLYEGLTGMTFVFSATGTEIEATLTNGSGVEVSSHVYISVDEETKIPS